MNIKEFLALRVIQAFALGLGLGFGLAFVIKDKPQDTAPIYQMSEKGALLNPKTGELWRIGTNGWVKIADSPE